MSRLTLLLLAAGIFDTAFAKDCTQVVDSKERLACFDATRACAAVQGDEDRLECFDAAHSNFDAIHASPEEFAKTRVATAPSDKVIAIITDVQSNARDIDFVELDNGHVWRENEDSHVRFVVGREVKIEEGIFGSYNLTMQGSGKKVKVKRVK